MNHTDTTAEQDLDLLVRQIRLEADGVVSLLLEHPAGRTLPRWGPGAHIDLHLPGGLVRQYSLCGKPEDQTQWRVAVLREAEGRGGSSAVHTAVHPGMILRARGPRNNFPLLEAANYLFIAGGIGITPLLPMVAAATARGSTARVLYGGRSRATMAFIPELIPYNLRLVPQDEAGLLPLQEEITSQPADTLIYACGPEPLLEAVVAATERLGPNSVHLERFKAVEPTPQELAQDHAFEVEARRSGLSVTVAADTSIVRALESAGVITQTSCEEGICGTCETAVLAGEPIHRDLLLSEDERAKNQTMMICVGRCAGSRLVLDI